MKYNHFMNSASTSRSTTAPHNVGVVTSTTLTTTEEENARLQSSLFEKLLTFQQPQKSLQAPQAVVPQLQAQQQQQQPQSQQQQRIPSPPLHQYSMNGTSSNVHYSSPSSEDEDYIQEDDPEEDEDYVEEASRGGIKSTTSRRKSIQKNVGSKGGVSKHNRVCVVCKQQIPSHRCYQSHYYTEDYKIVFPQFDGSNGKVCPTCYYKCYTFRMNKERNGGIIEPPKKRKERRNSITSKQSEDLVRLKDEDIKKLRQELEEKDLLIKLLKQEVDLMKNRLEQHSQRIAPLPPIHSYQPDHQQYAEHSNTTARRMYVEQKPASIYFSEPTNHHHHHHMIREDRISNY
jgi:hypothetical protein